MLARQTFFFCLSVLLSLPTLAGGFRFGRRAVGTIESTLNLPSDLLIDSLAKAFPSRTHQNPAYASVLLYLESLGSKPTCHRTATAALISDCDTLEARNSDSRYRYAAQLAVCEFEATGVWYPSECRGSTHLKCIKRLEERPQWWTTLSNNIQNAMVICAAVRHDVEQERLLDLHRNVTKAQEQLYKAMDVSLNHVWDVQGEQKEFIGGWTTFLQRVSGDLSELQLDVTQKVRNGGELVEKVLSRFSGRIRQEQAVYEARIGEMDQAYRKASSENMDLSKKVAQSLEDTDRMMVEVSTHQQQELTKTIRAIETLNGFLATTASQSASELQGALVSLSTSLTATAAQLSSLPALYNHLLSTHSSLTQSLQDQEALQSRLHTTLSALEPRLVLLLSSAERVEKSLDDAETRIQSMGGLFNRSSFALGIFAFSLVLWLGRDNWRSMAGGVGVMGLEVWWGADLRLHQWPVWSVLIPVPKYDLVANGVMVEFVPWNVIAYIILPGFAAITLAATMWQKRKGQWCMEAEKLAV